MTKSILRDKSYKFSIHIVKVCQKLVMEKEFVLSKQLLRSGTAIGALIREAEFAESKKDFAHKMSIALKEANESVYWLDLMKDTELIEVEIYKPIHSLNKELVAMLVSTIKTTKNK
ncbi:four helix bundle protein [uncultured Aquimarina sp.]|uniref:four helix bundle protein n=1 Tax=uncultured Aquimarina sp. TaxID=575652 RepID=UPI00262D39D5|nr:four helix bundle protein [uncultured Aquimarina sp.]